MPKIWISLYSHTFLVVFCKFRVMGILQSYKNDCQEKNDFTITPEILSRSLILKALIPFLCLDKNEGFS